MGSGLILLEALRCIDEGGEFEEVRRAAEAAVEALQRPLRRRHAGVPGEERTHRAGPAPPWDGARRQARPAASRTARWCRTSGPAAASGRWRRSSRRSKPAAEAGRPLYFGHIAAPEPLAELAEASASRRSSSPRSAGSSGRTSAREPMAWPTSRESAAAGDAHAAATDDPGRPAGPRPVTELPGRGAADRGRAQRTWRGLAGRPRLALPLPPRGPLERKEDRRPARRGEGDGRRPGGEHEARWQPVRGRAPGFSAQLYDGTGYMPVTVWGRGWLLEPARARDSGSWSRARCRAATDIQLAAKSIEVVDDPETGGRRAARRQVRAGLSGEQGDPGAEDAHPDPPRPRRGRPHPRPLAGRAPRPPRAAEPARRDTRGPLPRRTGRA